MKRKRIYKGTKRSIVLSVLNGTYTIAQAAQTLHVQPATIKRWLDTVGQDVLVTNVTSE